MKKVTQLIFHFTIIVFAFRYFYCFTFHSPFSFQTDVLVFNFQMNSAYTIIYVST